MRVGIVTTWFERGAAYVSKQYKETLEKQGCDVFIYVRGGECYEENNPIWDSDKVYWSRKEKFLNSTYTSCKELLSWTKRNKIDVVIFNEQSWLKSVITLKKNNIKVGAYIDYYTEDMLNTFLIYDFLLCNTVKHYSAFKDLHPYAYYIPWGTDISLFNTRNQRNRSDRVRFFHSAGMSSYRKGTDLLIESYLKLDSNEQENCHLIIHAQTDPFIGLTELNNKKIKELIKVGNVTLIEKTVTAPGLYHLGDVYVYPSRLDGIGLSITEALACGMPVIVPDNGPMNEFMSPNSYAVKIDKLFCRADAYYWPMNEVCTDDLSTALKYYINNKNHLEYFSNEARETAVEKYSFEKNMSNLVSLIRTTPKSDLYDSVLENCIVFTNKKFPLLYQCESFYKASYTLYKYIKR